MALRSVKGLGVAILVTAVGIVALFAVSTWGVSAFSQARSANDSGVGAMPLSVQNAPASIGTTEQYGPLGTVSMVYAGTEVENGLVDSVDQPWVAIAARSGRYRAIAAPELPPTGDDGVAVNEAGDRLAWATGEGVEVYDTTTGEAREVALDGASRIGDFSPDGSMVTVHADGLALLDLESGEVAARADGTEPDVVPYAAWRADSSAVDYVAGADLVTLPADGSDATTQPSPVDAGVPMAWAPDGEQLVALQKDAKGVPGLVSVPAQGDGRLGEATAVDTSGVSIDGLLGFSSAGTVAVTAYLLESGNIERILDIKLDGGTPVSVSTLPSPGENWRSSSTLTVSDQALRSGATDFGSQPWPWSYTARLAACALVGLFGLGLWLTRRRFRRLR